MSWNASDGTYIVLVRVPHECDSIGLVHTADVLGAGGTPKTYPTGRKDAAGNPILAEMKAGTWAKLITYGGPQAERRWSPGQPANGFAFQDDLEVAGRPWDYVSGLQNNRARWFSPSLGHFITSEQDRTGRPMTWAGDIPKAAGLVCPADVFVA